MTPLPSSSSPAKEVGFGRIAFREYPIIMGGNPSVSEGVPVTLDWEFFNEYDVEVDTYEIAANKEFTYTAGSRRCPKLDVAERAQMLLRQGYSMRDIVECTLEVLDIKEKRSDSVRSRKWDGFNSFVEVTKRAMMKKRKSSSRKLLQLSLQAPPPAAPSSRQRRSEMPTPPTMRRPSRRRSLELTPNLNKNNNVNSSSPQQDVFKVRNKAPRRRSTLMVDDTMMNRTFAMSA